MSAQGVLALPSLTPGDQWCRVRETDPYAVEMMNRHYSRRNREARRIGGPWKSLVLMTADSSALWVAGYSTKPMDGKDAVRCHAFRNEGAHLASDLIRSAVAATEASWPDVEPRDGWLTWVDGSKVAPSNPGYCYLRAGWELDRSYQPDRRRRFLRRYRLDWRAS